MNQTICDRCGLLISNGPVIRWYQWQRTQPNGTAYTYDLCGKCDTDITDGIVEWDDSAHSEPSPT